MDGNSTSTSDSEKLKVGLGVTFAICLLVGLGVAAYFHNKKKNDFQSYRTGDADGSGRDNIQFHQEMGSGAGGRYQEV